MAVEPLHLNLINNREFIGQNEGNRTVIGSYGGNHPISGMTIANWNSQPIYVDNNACSNNLLISRKRSRDSISFLGEDISLEIQNHQLEIDQLIAMHAEQMKLYIQERRMIETMRIIETVEQRITKKLKERDEEIAKIGQINWNLQEKVRNLCNENQLWKDLAERNEMTVNVLKSNLEQMMMIHHHHHDQIQEQQQVSFCSSNSINGGFCEEVAGAGDRMCRRCGKEESSVLLLPCRHLCVCSGCESCVNSCPICQCTKNGTVNINLLF
ncbi:probable BOI-related E3 ubiquitin-protein ligase 3 [Impatiens glandulifera]|uniref:probable BOI-related E3 ubiquitin-protein ligase 3 n=1 Tax=Impatiens glandulifera TaxID=253017 RepID=UPI001FB0D02D|nr:probable BOI-related E3 ubiquitin-protein ligase 3 [Impatiens glandulifera]